MKVTQRRYTVTRRSTAVYKLAGKHPGREAELNVQRPVAMTVKSRMYLVGKRLFQLMVIVPAIASEPDEDVERFLGSLKL